MSLTYKFKKRTPLAELENAILPESDLLYQTDKDLIQMEAIDDDKKEKIIIRPGSFMIARNSGGCELKDFELKKRVLLAVDNTTTLLNEANTFFSKLSLYDELEVQKKRGVLCYSSPGFGKTACLENFCFEMLQKDKGTVVMFYPTSKINADDVHDFLALESEYSPECTNLIVVIEDIGGVASDRIEKGTTAGLLNLLDGAGNVFKLPTFVIATTNHPQTLLQSLSDRPGRFDLMIEFKKLKAKERLELISFFAKRELTEEEIAVISKKELEELSVAHLKEVVVRSRLHDKTFAEVVKELLEHSKKVKKDFTSNKGMGMFD
jgi:SpoVK/Ycf46/Vps4 family AAA+-type ATPase